MAVNFSDLYDGVFCQIATTRAKTIMPNGVEA